MIAKNKVYLLRSVKGPVEEDGGVDGAPRVEVPRPWFCMFPPKPAFWLKPPGLKKN